MLESYVARPDAHLKGAARCWALERIDMTATIARIFPRATAASAANIDAFITVALFSGLGLLLSLTVLVLDQYSPVEWF